MNDPFMTRAQVPDFDIISARYKILSDAARSTIRHIPNVAYGLGAAERLDIFCPAGVPYEAPVHIFVHGGYWRANRKEDYAFVAGPIIDNGAIAVIVEYDLMPAFRMATLISQVRMAANWVRDNIAVHGGDPRNISASGHSAGAHLASYLAATGPHEQASARTSVKGILLLSGIYDLVPIATSFLQAEIQLNTAEIAQWSPISAVPTCAVRRTVAVGELETSPFHEQADRYAKRLSHYAPQPKTAVLAGLNHMNIVLELGQRGSKVEDLLLRTIRE